MPKRGQGQREQGLEPPKDALPTATERPSGSELLRPGLPSRVDLGPQACPQLAPTTCGRLRSGAIYDVDDQHPCSSKARGALPITLLFPEITKSPNICSVKPVQLGHAALEKCLPLGAGESDRMAARW